GRGDPGLRVLVSLNDPPSREVMIARGEVRATRPLPVRILLGEDPRSEPLGGDARPRRLPYGLRSAQQVAFDLPSQRRIRVEQPVDPVLRERSHARTLRRRTDNRNPPCT